MNKHNQFEVPNWVFGIYVSIVIGSLVLTNKIINIHGAVFSACSLTFPFATTIVDVVAEQYGYHAGKKIIWQGLALVLFFSSFITLAIQIPSANFYDNSLAYHTVLGNSLKLTLVAIIAIYVGSLTNIHILTKWKVLVAGKYFWLRYIGGTWAGALINSLISIFFAFGGLINNHTLLKMACTSFLIKITYYALAAFPAQFIIIMINKFNTDSKEKFSLKPKTV